MRATTNVLLGWCLGLLILLSVASPLPAQAQKLEPGKLRCEYLENPLGIDTARPRFSWFIRSSERGVSQSAYQVLVATSTDKLENNIGDMWDSGQVDSEESVNVTYKGDTLQSGTTYHWKVKVWNQDENMSSWSDPATFHTGFLDASEWNANWIGAADKAISAPLLRKEISSEKQVESAHVYVAGLGYYELYLNGRKVGDHVLDPGTTEYDKRVLYETYDVSGYLRNGDNAVGIILGNGWYRHRKTRQYGIKPVLLLQMELQFEDGTSTTVVSDPTWKVSSGPITGNSIWDGEVYDARLEKKGWKSPGYDDSKWEDAVKVEGPAGELDSQLMPPIKVTKTLRPVKMTEPKDGVYVFDFGQNMTGWPRLYVDGPRGTEITMRAAEVTKAQMAQIKGEEVEGVPGLIEPSPNRSAKARDVYILKGADGTEVYEPRFTYHGFRYVQVEGFPGDPDMLNLDVKVVHSAVEPVGRFDCSNDLINQIHENILWGQLSNLHSMPTDCPQRDERQGWMGDAHLTAEEAIYNFDMAAFYTKWLRDIRDSQHEDGSVPDCVPYHNYGGKVGTPAWQVAYPLCTWYMYRYYSDTRILQEHYSALEHWMEYMDSIAEDSIITKGRGDWVPPKLLNRPDDGSIPITSTGYYYRSARIMSRMASILGKFKESERYAELAQDIKKAFNAEFLNKETHQYGQGSQTCNAFALYSGLVPEDEQKSVVDNLVTNILDKNDGHLTTGILGTKAVVESLMEHERYDVLYTLATQRTFPSWGYMISRGATTLWERWGGYRFFGPGMNSLNHIMFGCIDEFFYAGIAGISPSSPGFTRVSIKPRVLGDLTAGSGSIDTLRGVICCDWEKKGNSFVAEVSIPANTRAQVSLPKMGLSEVLVDEQGRVVWQKGSFAGDDVAGIARGRESEDYVTFDVGSGTYQFHLHGRPVK